MNIRHTIYAWLAAGIGLLFAACDDHEAIENPVITDGVEISLEAGLTRAMGAVEVPELKDYVGKSVFENQDRAVFTVIKRTNNPIGAFTYKNVEFSAAVSSSAEGKYSIGWQRDKNTGTVSSESGDAHPDRIYWSDAQHPHTFIGYCKPQQGSGNKEFDWTNKVVETYLDVFYGSIGDPTEVPTETQNKDVDFRSTYEGDGENLVKSGNVELRKNDILLTFSDSIVASDAVAKVMFRHGLAQVRVIVNISDFAAGGGVDTLSVVSDMILKDMLTMYKWQQTNACTVALAESDQTNISKIYSDQSVKWNQKKDFKLWIPNPVGIGKGSSRTFTFYGLAVPTKITSSDNPLQFSFKVTYPNPMNPNANKTVYYQANIKSLTFSAGKCTTITISLNHSNEKITVGAEYDDWEYVDTPDEGSLKKHSTFLDDLNRSSVTIHSDKKATVDDATWLYKSGKDNQGKDIILDIYGHDGSSLNSPYTISSAEELLSFTYEVNNGYSFEDKYVKLDANLYLQKSVSSEDLSWPGIGVIGASSSDSKAFNGTFLGGNRTVKRLAGSSFFVNIGPKARIDALLLEDVLDITSGGGALASLNQGVICASTVTSISSGSFKIKARNDTIWVQSVSSYTPKSSSVAGPLVGRNEGVVFACHSQGSFTTDAARVGGLVGYNTGALVASFAATKETTTSSASEGDYRGIVGYNDYKKHHSGTNKEDNEFGSIAYCFFDKTIANNVAEGHSLEEVHPKSTVEMKKSDFIGEKDRYGLMSEETITLLKSLSEKEMNPSGGELTEAEKTLKTSLLKTLNGTIAYIAYHSTLCPKVIKDAYSEGSEAQMLVLVNHFLNHYYTFRVGDYPQVN